MLTKFCENPTIFQWILDRFRLITSQRQGLAKHRKLCHISRSISIHGIVVRGEWVNWGRSFSIVSTTIVLPVGATTSQRHAASQEASPAG